MGVLDRYVEFTLADKKHKLLYTVKAIAMVEKELANHNLITTMTKTKYEPLSISDTYALFKWGLLGSKHEEEEVEDIFYGFLDENSLADMQILVMQGVEKSGIIGKVKK